MTWKRWAALVLLPLVANALGCAAYPAKARLGVQETVDADELRKIVVETESGAIEIQGDPQAKEVRIEAEKYAKGLTEDEARAYAERISVSVRREPAQSSQLRITTRFPLADSSRDHGVDFRITVPTGPSLLLKTHFGSVAVTDGANDVEIDSRFGDVTLLGCKGRIRAETRFGKMTAEDVAGDLDIESRYGEIRLIRVRGDRFKAHTRYGSIDAKDVQGHADLCTRHGSIRLQAPTLPDAPEIRAVTRYGRVEVELPKTVKARLRMQTHYGDLNADLKDLDVREVQARHKELAATLNGGGGSIEIESRHGPVTFRTVAAGE